MQTVFIVDKQYWSRLLKTLYIILPRIGKYLCC